MLFSELKLKDSSLKAIEKLGYTEATEIQERALPILMEADVDFIGQAQTGSGKTAAFVLPLLEKLDFKSPNLQALILAPTRELANQINEEINKLSHFQKIRTIAVYGGTSVGLQIKDYKAKKPQIVAGTPGRVMDLISRGIIQLENVKFVVLDEADEMLDMGFFDDVQEILSQVPEKKIWMFSATMPGPIVKLISEHFQDPINVKVTKRILTADSIVQQFVVVRRDHQIEALCRYLDINDEVYAIVFTRTKIGAKELTDELNARGYPTDSLHGDMDQSSRDFTMKKFKEKKITLLVCTDVAARGIDVSNLTHVINFSLPQDNEAYVHRIGRTGRGGAKGIALSIIEPNELSRIGQIERITKAKIDRISLPKVSELKEKLINKSLKGFSSLLEVPLEDSEEAKLFLDKFSNLTKEQLLLGVYRFVFENTLRRYKNAQDLEVVRPARSMSASNGVRLDQKGMQRFFINVGNIDGVNTGSMIKFLSQTIGLSGRDIGKIDIKEKFSFFEIPAPFIERALDIKGEMIGQRRISIELAQALSRPKFNSRPRARSN